MATLLRRGNTGDMMLWLHGSGIGVGLGVLGALLPTGNMVTIPAGPFVRGDEANNEHVARGAYFIPITSLEPGDPQ